MGHIATFYIRLKRPCECKQQQTSRNLQSQQFGYQTKMTDTEAWGQLVSLTDIYSEPIQLTTDKYLIGRALGKLKKLKGGFVLVTGVWRDDLSN